MKTNSDFLEAYERLAEDGKCDDPGGMECQRVFGEWELAGRPSDIDSFIRIRANWIPDCPTLAERN